MKTITKIILKSKDRSLFQSILMVALIILTISCQSNSTKIANTQAATVKVEEQDIAQIQQGYKDKRFTIKEVVQAYLDRIAKLDKSGPSINSIITINPDAISIAEALDKELNEGKSRGPMHGIPVILKDNIDTHDKMATTAGSRALLNSHPLKDSFVAQRLRGEGAIILGKANLSEWANFRGQMSTSGWSGAGGQTKNPYDLTRNPCGSSSGSAAAVAANLTMVAIGTETNGSIVCPAQTNGIVGIKPTVGLISRNGVIPISFTQDTPGPMGRTVRDAAICLGALVGVDSADQKTLASKGEFQTNYTKFLNKDGLKGKRIGIDKSASGINFKVDSLFNQALKYLKQQGATTVAIGPIYAKEADNYSYEIMLYEYKDGLNNYFKSLGQAAPIKNIQELIAFNKSDSIELKYFNQKFLELAERKGALSSEEYKKALAKLMKGSREEGLDRVMNSNNLDAIIAPTGAPAWKTDLTNGDSFGLGSSSAAAQAGYPSITVPMGFIDELPVGISFFGRAWSEPLLIEMAYGYENGTKFRRAPKFLH
jgi:amidase